MRAIQVSVPGGPEALTLVTLPDVAPASGQVRVRTEAIGVGRPDVLIRNGTYKWMPPLPAIPGAELAGTIDAVGPEVTRWRVGDRVLVSARELPVRGGCYAEAIVVPQEAPFPLPAGLDAHTAVSAPNLQLAHALFLAGGATTAKSVLITGAAGGVATMLAQLAKHRGMAVLGSVRSEAKRQFAMANGFDEVFNTASAPLSQSVRTLMSGSGVDLAFDPIGGQSLTECLHSLAPMGTVVSYNAVAGLPPEDVFVTMRSLLGRSLALRCFSMHTFDADAVLRRRLMDESLVLLAAGHVRVPTPTVLRLHQVQEAHRILDAGATMGKIVLTP
ncbi:MAG: alcohol dehydrogenase [Burkholderiales bacterium]|nr:MAG: alcohol dehydrogenase [Burkholderiales bacterium]